VLDTIGGETQERSWSVLKKDGVLVSLVQPPSEEKAEELGVRASPLLSAFSFIFLAQKTAYTSEPDTKHDDAQKDVIVNYWTASCGIGLSSRLWCNSTYLYVFIRQMILWALCRQDCGPKVGSGFYFVGQRYEVELILLNLLC
jgi:hypothetical protein